MLKNCSLRSTFWRSAVEKLPGAVAKRTFGSENDQKLYARSGEGQGSDVVYVIECLSLHSVIASSQLVS